MRLLFVRSANKFSGAEKYNIELLSKLKKYHDVTLLTNLINFKSAKFKVIIENWLPEEVGTKKELLKTFFKLPIFLFLYLKRCRNYEIIIFESRTEMIFLSILLKLWNKKVVWIQHGPLFISNTASIIKKLVVLNSLFIDRIIAVSKNTKKDLVNGGINKNKIKVIYIGVEIPIIKRTPHSFTIGFLGTVTKEKGIIKFVNYVLKHKVKALVIGDGPDRDLVPNNISQVGYVTNVYSYLRKIDLLYLPTNHFEGISLAILEAMSCGIPVVTTNIGGNKEVIKNRYNGLLVSSKQSFSLNHNWKILGSNAKKTIKDKFNILIQVKRFAYFFNNI